ncbi:MAG: FAD-binding oxidoreductase [Betaproteobacteria bacterium]|nr:FAD-binding oxidoreductase [Betaproteobacteria bacterium]
MNLTDLFAPIVGPAGLVTDASALRVHNTDWRGRYHGDAALAVKPASTTEVAAVVRACHEARIGIVPQGGNTSQCGASIPRPGHGEIILNLSRMNRILETDWDNDTLTCEAGAVLADVQSAAQQGGHLFPLSIASEGSAEIGGIISTNAGGTAVLRYGNMRSLVLGLEVVLPDGRIWNGLRGLRKDNTGYDLKQWFIGAEGTLGIITTAVLRLFPLPHARATAWIAVPSPQAAVSLLGHLRARSGERVTGFELVSRMALQLVLQHIPDSRDPLPQPAPWYVLAEMDDTDPAADPHAILSAALDQALEKGLVLDAAIAQSESQINALWALREQISEAQRREGISIKHDISVPVSRIPAFIEEASTRLQEQFPGIRVVCFGHVGDGNLHYNLSKPNQQENSGFIGQTPAVNRVVHDTVDRLGGSISAEHGIGQLKVDELVRYKDPVALELMRRIKGTLDPLGIMNPGKVFRTTTG